MCEMKLLNKVEISRFEVFSPFLPCNNIFFKRSPMLFYIKSSDTWGLASVDFAAII